ncbi:uncharacterized protein LOC126803887 [Argentina anserina]|uniref:uncharacterized protein LOC126803887 n=1 Tax=Argentina anserina TaxID=57926 RepID=UPI002176889F|nr:uncharacterized protein LOC126803887 [Potentilla anserina]
MDSMDEVEPEPPPPPPTQSLPLISNLILSLEQATLLAKQLPSTTDPTQLLLIHSSLHHAHHHLSTFLSTTHSSAAGNDPMDFGGDEENSKVTIEKVEEQMRGCFIKNKRGRKRQLSPSAAPVAEERRLDGDGLEGSMVGYDPHETKSRALELVHQFHL